MRVRSPQYPALGSVEIRGDSTGTTDLTVSVEEMDDDEGQAIEAQTDPSVVVVGPPGLGEGPGGSPPTDPDSDGHFEDVNGNGRMDYDDIVLLFKQFDSDAVTMNKAAYDFNDNGKLDFDDIVSLYEEN